MHLSCYVFHYIESSASAIRQLVVIELARRVYFAVIAPSVKTLISVRASSKNSFSLPAFSLLMSLPCCGVYEQWRELAWCSTLRDVYTSGLFPPFISTTKTRQHYPCAPTRYHGGVLCAKISRNSPRLRWIINENPIDRNLRTEFASYDGRMKRRDTKHGSEYKFLFNLSHYFSVKG